MTEFSRNTNVSDETLNAYVDGALCSREAAVVARICASDPQIARRVANLHQLKAGVAGLVDDVILLEPASTVRAVRPNHGLRLGLAGLLAASVLAATVLSGALLHNDDVKVSNGDAISGLVVQHDAWTRAINSESATSPISDWLTEVLGATGLSLVHHAKLMAPDGSSTQHFAFLGPNGCKLSLFISPRPDESPVPLEYSISQALLTAHWSEGGRGYALIARTMNDARFVAIASAVHEVSRRRGVIDDQLLAEMRDARQPCIG